jgi:alanine dehydrogenase
VDFGIPREIQKGEGRLAVTPAAVNALVRRGNRVFVQTGAGAVSGFDDEDFLDVGATVVHTPEEAFGRAEVIVKVSAPTEDELSYLHSGQTLMTFLNLAIAPKSVVEGLLKKDITTVAFEMIEEPNGNKPVLLPMSEIAGRMTVQVAGNLLETTSGGKGKLVGGVPGVPPVEVAILGAGTVGYNAARSLVGVGAHVSVLDRNVEKLRCFDEMFCGGVNTMIAMDFNIRKVLRFADVFVGCILASSGRTPRVVTTEMVRSMRPKSVILDISIDQGGCVETSRPTTHMDPTYLSEGIIHYCVPNMTAHVARTATHALANVLAPMLVLMAETGVAAAISDDGTLRKGVMTHAGHVMSPHVAESHGIEAKDLDDLV